MILSYGCKNIWAFKEWLEIDLRANGYVPAEYRFGKKGALSALCFIGPNASGKSCALKVLAFISDFSLNSFSYPVEEGIIFDSYFNNEEKSEFFIDFCVDDSEDVEYSYEVTLNNKKIFKEKLTQKGTSKKLVLFERNNNNITINNLADNVSSIRLKDNSSVISTWAQYGVKEIMPFWTFFQLIASNISYTGTREENLSDHSAKYYHDNPKMLNKVIELLKEFDTGISDVRIESGIDKNNRESYYSVFTHTTEDGDRVLPYVNQSTGTKVLYNRLMDFITVLNEGGVLVFDEIDNHLHSDIVPILISYFLNPGINTKNAQIIFTSHNESILDMMKKYRTYIFKKETNSSFAYRVDELKNNIAYRNDRSLESVYRSGDIGGRPNV